MCGKGWWGPLMSSEHLLCGRHILMSSNLILTPVPDFTKQDQRPGEETDLGHKGSSTKWIKSWSL